MRAHELAAKKSPNAVRRVEKIAKQGGAQRDGVAVELAANKVLLERGLGMPGQSVSIEVVQKIQDETRQMIQAITNALDAFPEAKAAAIAALEPYLGQPNDSTFGTGNW
jgi:ribosomal protein L31E